MEGSVRVREEDEQIIMADELYKAAMHDKIEVFDDKTRRDGEYYFLRKTWESNNNILHIALRHDSWRFVEEVRKRYPHLIWERNLYGDTPLHFAAEFRERRRPEHLFVEEFLGELTDTTPLKIQNSLGNTLLHVALIHNHFHLAFFLIDKDPSLSEILNSSDEAPLHLALKHFPHDLTYPDDSGGKKERRFIQIMEEKAENWFDIVRHIGLKQDFMGVLIRRLLDQASYVARKRDASGLSPLHRAALLPTMYNLKVVKHIMECCPQSIEVCDITGKTILHHLVNRIRNVTEARDLLCNTRVDGLVNYQDQEGNTAGHLAVTNNDINMLHLLKLFAKFKWGLKNKLGLSTTTLLHVHNLSQKLKIGSMTDEMSYAAENADVFGMPYTGSLEIFEKQDSNGRNIFHKLFEIKTGHVIIPDHIEELIERLRSGVMVVDVSDNNGDTPTHVLAQLNPDSIMIHLATGPRDDSLPIEAKDLYPGPKPDYPHCFDSRYMKYTYVWTNLGKTDFFTELIDELWLVRCRGGESLDQNAKGNTPLHEALIAKNYPVFTELVWRHEDAPALVNNRNQTILNLLASLNPTPEVSERVMTKIIKNNTEEERHLYNEDGLSLLMSAIKVGNIEFAEKMCSIRPSIAKCKDFDGQTFWHHFVHLPPIQPSFNFAGSSFTDEVVCGQLATKDKQGQTPLHRALDRRRFDLAETFLGLGGKLNPNGTPVFQEYLLKIPDTEGVTPANIIGKLSYVPREFEDFMGRVSTMIGIRSIWGIPTAQMKEYVNTMGVIAALLTTITFTAGFAVPGGFDQEKGTPLLMSELSFQVFMFFDIIAMCLSMMVLFCLLWIMAIDKQSTALVLLDFSIILLQLSFYTTLVTFMTGVFATTHVVKLWVAVVALVLCSILILLMQKCLVLKFIVPFGKFVLVYYNRGSQSAKKFLKNIRRQRSSSPVLPITCCCCC